MLRNMGVAAVYTPKDYALDAIMADIVRVVDRAVERRKEARPRLRSATSGSQGGALTTASPRPSPTRSGEGWARCGMDDARWLSSGGRCVVKIS